MEVMPLHDNVKRMHAYYSLEREIDRLRALVVALGYDPDTGEPIADLHNFN